jgi:UDP-GlcNAc3NAcA epimerase
MKVLTIVGARPQFIKASVVSKALEQSGVQEILVHTGQHFDEAMSQAFFEELGLRRPKYNLEIHSLSHAAMTGNMMVGLEKIMKQECPDFVLVFGDTNSTLAGAISAKKLGIKVAHVEAGLRSDNEFQPEEINRIVTDRLSNLFFTTSEKASQNLLKEGHIKENIHQVGDVMYDLFLLQKAKARQPLPFLLPKRFGFLTLHRQENVDDPSILESWVEQLNLLHLSLPLICALHPRTAKKLEELGLQLSATIVAPLKHHESLQLALAAEVVLTDSGGLQKESYYCETPCLTLRQETEWTELLETGSNLLCSPVTLIRQYQKLMDAPKSYPLRYGIGNAGPQIARAIAAYK